LKLNNDIESPSLYDYRPKTRSSSKSPNIQSKIQKNQEIKEQEEESKLPGSEKTSSLYSKDFAEKDLEIDETDEGIWQILNINERMCLLMETAFLMPFCSLSSKKNAICDFMSNNLEILESYRTTEQESLESG